MSGETDLQVLLENIKPNLLPTTYAFICLGHVGLEKAISYQPIGTFVEMEGLTAIVPLTAEVTSQFPDAEPFSCITLNVHSSLSAVGLTAAVSTKLADNGISANVVAAFYHDHIFVAKKDALSALKALQMLASD